MLPAVGWHLFLRDTSSPKVWEDSAGTKLCSPPAKLINVQIKKDVRALKKHLLTKVKK